MPALTVSIDGINLATMSTDGYDVMSVRSIDGINLATMSTDGYDVMSVRAGGTRIDETKRLQIYPEALTPNLAGQLTSLR